MALWLAPPLMDTSSKRPVAGGEGGGGALDQRGRYFIDVLQNLTVSRVEQPKFL